MGTKEDIEEIQTQQQQQQQQNEQKRTMFYETSSATTTTTTTTATTTCTSVPSPAHLAHQSSRAGVGYVMCGPQGPREIATMAPYGARYVPGWNSHEMRFWNQQGMPPTHAGPPRNFSTGEASSTGISSRWFLYPGNNKPAHSHGTSGVKDIASSALLGDDKSCKDDNELWGAVEAQTAFLGPNLWDKSYETDLKYVDLDEFLSENGVSMDGLTPHLTSGGNSTPSHPLGSGGSAGLSSISSLSNFGGLPAKRERSASPSECASPSTDTLNPPSPADSSLSLSSSGRDFDPRVRVFSDEELKPQPMIKKSRKQFVPDDLKDDKYWARRRKNNMAAKRSRDARRLKENQIALRAGYLEKENMGLRQELERLRKENVVLRDKLSKYTDV